MPQVVHEKTLQALLILGKLFFNNRFLWHTTFTNISHRIRVKTLKIVYSYFDGMSRNPYCYWLCLFFNIEFRPGYTSGI